MITPTRSSHCRFVTIIWLLFAATILFALTMDSRINHCLADDSSKYAVILQYHKISPKLTGDTTIKPERFQAHIDYLKANQFNVLPLEYVIERLRQRKPLPEKSVAITFDDAHRSTFEYAFPIMKQHNWPFAIFANIKSISAKSDRHLTWEHLRQMGQYGVTIGNHSMSHPYLIRRSHQESFEEWRERAKNEIVQAGQRIEAETGQAHRLFAYPYGEYSAPLQALVKELGYVGFGQHSGPIGYDSNFLALPRFPVSGIYSKLSTFAIKLASRPMPVTKTVFRDNHGNPLSSHVLPFDISKPVLELQLDSTETALKRLSCFASGENAIPIFIANPEKGEIRTQSTQDIRIGRSRYNCTLPTATPNSYYWFSQPWIRLAIDSQWQAR